MQEKYGFVYLWFDRKRKRYYVGSHWGTENDGYICSSNWMNITYKRRSEDFKRRILKRVYTNRNDLLDEEQRYLKMISPFEMGVRYYNQTLFVNKAWTTTGRKYSDESRAKMSKSQKGRVVSEEAKVKLREANKRQFENEEQREIRRQKSLALWADPSYRQAQIDKKKGIPTNRVYSEETKQKMRIKAQGRKHTPETLEKIRLARKRQTENGLTRGYKTR